jgi:hypothetical protein
VLTANMTYPTGFTGGFMAAPSRQVDAGGDRDIHNHGASLHRQHHGDGQSIQPGTNSIWCRDRHCLPTFVMRALRGTADDEHRALLVVVTVDGANRGRTATTGNDGRYPSPAWSTVDSRSARRRRDTRLPCFNRHQQQHRAFASGLRARRAPALDRVSTRRHRHRPAATTRTSARQPATSSACAFSETPLPDTR